MNKLTVYLAGPITGLPYKEISEWRLSFKEKYQDIFEIKSPLDSRYDDVDKSSREDIEQISIEDRLCILNSDVTIANVNKSSAGTAMGILYAYLSGRTVVVVKPDHHRSPMIKQNCHYVCDSFNEAVEFIKKRFNRQTIKTIKNRGGKVVPWQPDKIRNVLQKTINGVFKLEQENSMGGVPNAQILSNAVVMKLEDDLERGIISYDDLDVEKIQDTIEHLLMTNCHIKEVNTLVKEFIIYRSKRTEDRLRRQEEQSSQIIDDDTRKFLRDIIHDIKGYVGWAGRFIATIEKESSQIENKNLAKNITKCKENIETIKGIIDEGNMKIEQRFKIEGVSLSTFITDLIKKKKSDDIKFDLDIDKSIVIKTNQHKLRSIFNVLIENSIIHGLKNKKGTIHISIGKVPHSNDVEIEYWNDGKTVDTHDTEFVASGSKEHMPKTSNWRHGMLQVNRYIRDIGGTIEIYPMEENEEKGIKYRKRVKEGYYYVKIVLKKKNIGSIDIQNERNILVVDDNADDRSNMIFALTNELDGLTVFEASTIDAAVAIIAEKEIYGMVTDLDLKEAHDGLWLIHHLNEKKPDARSILVSGVGSKYDGSNNWKADAENLGAKAYDKDTYTIEDIKRFLFGVL